MKHPHPFQRLVSPAALAVLALLAAACGSGNDNNFGNTNIPTTPSEVPVSPPPVAAPARLVANVANTDVTGPRTFTEAACSLNATTPRAAGKVYSVNLQSKSGHNIAFTVFEPKSFNCKQGNPLMLQGHGYGGARETTASGLIKRMIDSGAGVISIDQRGFNESGGTVRVMDPDFEGQDLLQILDWAEANLDWLRYSDDKPVGTRQFNPVIGSTGGSYGGGYQLLIHNIDPKQRLDALTPDIAWNDLRHSLNPGGPWGIKDFKPAEGEITPVGTVKSGWALLLVAAGESGSLGPKLQSGDPTVIQSSGQDMLIRETLLRGAASNRFPTGALEFFRYHSPSYWCDAEVPGEQVFLQSTVIAGLKPKKPQPVNILFTQGFRDTLFNYNDGFHNFSCYRGLKDSKGQGADVRLLTHQSGHILPLSPQSAPGVSELAEQGAQNGLNEIEFQKPGGPFACGDLKIQDAQYAFLVEKLFTAEEAAALEKTNATKAFASLRDNKGKVCLSLNDDVAQTDASPNAALWVSETEFLANNNPLAKGLKTASKLANQAIDLTVGSPTTSLVSGPLGLLRYPVAPAVQVLNLPAGNRVIAGIPTATLQLAPPAAPLMNPACGPIQSGLAQSPVGALGLEPGCDPMVFVGLGVQRNGAWRLIDDQVTPVRGYGKRHVELAGVAERLQAGEQLGLLVYSYHPQYLATASRDLASPLVSLTGTLQLPVLP